MTTDQTTVVWDAMRAPDLDALAAALAPLGVRLDWENRFGPERDEIVLALRPAPEHLPPRSCVLPAGHEPPCAAGDGRTWPGPHPGPAPDHDEPTGRPTARLSGPDVCQTADAHGQPICVRTLGQRLCVSCPDAPEQPAPPATSAGERPAGGGPHPGTPEGAGPGWDRHNVERIIAMVRTIPQGASGDGDQLAALLDYADRVTDLLAGARCDLLEQVADAHHKLTEVTAERDRLDRELAELRQEQTRWRAEVRECHRLQGNVAHVLGVQTDWDDEGRAAVLDAACRLTGNLADAHRQVSSLEAELASCIWVDPRRQSGAPCLGGTRIPVDSVSALLAEGLDGDQIRGIYPGVTDQHLDAVKHFTEAVVDDDWAGEVDRLNAKVSRLEAELVAARAELGRRVARFESVLVTARRDGAADALDDAARYICQVFAESIDPEVGRVLEALAYNIRTGAREVPAPASGEAG